jgi:hypothetical protein
MICAAPPSGTLPQALHEYGWFKSERATKNLTFSLSS